MHEARSHGETFFSELRFSVNISEVYGYRRERRRRRRDGAGPQAVDEAVRAEIIETVRTFVRREVIPVAAELERTDTFPTEIVEQMRDLGLFGVTIPEAYGGLGLDLLTYIGVIEELSYGWMSLTGIVNTHTMAATLILTHGNEEQKRRWLPAMAAGERRGALSLSEPDAGSDTRNISLPRPAGRRRVRPQRHQGLGHQRRARRASSPWRPAPKRASPPSSSRRSPDRRFEGISVSKHVGKLGYRGVETVEMAYADHRIPAANLIGEPDAACPRSSACSRSAASTSPPGPSAWRGRRSTPRSPTPNSARPSARSSASTRPSS